MAAFFSILSPRIRREAELPVPVIPAFPAEAAHPSRYDTAYQHCEAVRHLHPWEPGEQLLSGYLSVSRQAEAQQ